MPSRPGVPGVPWRREKEEGEGSGGEGSGGEGRGEVGEEEKWEGRRSGKGGEGSGGEERGGDGAGVTVSMTFSLGAPPVDDRSGGFVVSVG